jgi:hypothetical protein
VRGSKAKFLLIAKFISAYNTRFVVHLNPVSVPTTEYGRVVQGLNQPSGIEPRNFGTGGIILIEELSVDGVAG